MLVLMNGVEYCMCEIFAGWKICLAYAATYVL